MSIRFDVISIFPKVFAAVFEGGVVGRAVERGLVSLYAHDLRDHSRGPHRQVDDVPFGGGAGMVLKPEPLFEAVESIRAENRGPVILMEPWGESLNQPLARELAGEPGLIIVCGRYEGVDDRVREGLGARELSIGDYVLSGGEIPAMAVIDAVARLLPGVVGEPRSLAQDSFAGGWVGYPQYTRPAEYRGMVVPEVLTSGNHQKITEWRRRAAEERTRARQAHVSGMERKA
ncbi:MAG: tRNA (guanosine(37)-N1)-methyltransferase TrmD [Candidatus Dormibacteraceae bacterium]